MATPNIQGTWGSFISSAVTLLHSELLQHLQGTSRRDQTCQTCVQRIGSTLKFRLLVLSHLKLKVYCNQSVTALICNQIVNKDIQSGRRLSLKPNHYKIAVVYCFLLLSAYNLFPSYRVVLSRSHFIHRGVSVQILALTE